MLELSVEKRNERDATIDIARGIAVALMVFGHLGIKEWPVQFIYAFHMPLFFFISGMTIHKADSIKNYVIKRIKRILVPYFLFAMIFSMNGMRDMRDYMLVVYGSRNALAEASSLTPLWFLPCLFVSDIIFQLVLQMFDRRDKENYILAAAILIGIIGILLNDFLPIPLGLPFGAEIAMVAIPFVTVGWYIQKSAYRSMKYIMRLGGTIILFVVVLCLYRLNLPPSVTVSFAHIEMSIGSFGNIGLFYLCAFSGSLSIILFSTLIKSGEFFIKVGQSTLACLGTHGLVIAIISAEMSKVISEPIIVSLVAFICVFIALRPIDYFLKKFIPNIIGL